MVSSLYPGVDSIEVIMQWFRLLVLLTLVVGCSLTPPDTSPPTPPGR